MRRRVSELDGLTMPGQPRIPYDQTDPMAQVAAPPQSPAGMPGQAHAGAPDLGALGGGGGDPASILAGLGASAGAPDGGVPEGMPGGGVEGLGAPPAGAGGDPASIGGEPSTDDLTGNQLAALSAPVDAGTNEDAQLAQMAQVLDDPQADPDEKAQIQEMLDLAARRRLAGLGGQGAASGGLMGA